MPNILVVPYYALMWREAVFMYQRPSQKTLMLLQMKMNLKPPSWEKI